MCSSKNVFALFLIVSLCYSEDKFYIEKNHIVVKDNSSPFQQLVNIGLNTKFHICSDIDTVYCLKWEDDTLFRVTEKNECKSFEYKSTTEKPLKTGFNITSIHIYGGAEADDQKWPIETGEYKVFPFVSNHENSQAVLEPFWIFSTGHYVYVEKGVPLFTAVNKTENKFEIIAENKPPYLTANETILKYRVCKLNDMKKAYLHAVQNIFGKPKKIMDSVMVRKPIWSTWVKFKENITQEKVENYLNLILSNDFPISHIEIDDKWETCYGSLTVDTSRFPNLKNFTRTLKKKEIRTTLWVHPFVNVDCHPYHEEAKNSSYFVRNSTGTDITWWNGDAGYLDFTNKATTKWFQNRLQKLKNDTGVDSFKFDAGESSWSPKAANFQTMNADYPETILNSYVKMASNFGNMVEVRVGRGTQQNGVFVRMLDRDSRWDGPKSLKTLIPTLLQMNIVGYPYVLPDMIGGNEYNDDKITGELFIRWLQANVFMPALQFSVPPWDFGKNITKIALKMVKLHNSFSNDIQHLMSVSTKTGVPVNLPLWWIAPNDTTTYTIDDEFMLGEDILVAPVLAEGATSRHIYLPKGNWRDETRKKPKFIIGPKWLYNYSAELDTLPHFRRNYSNKATLNKSNVSMPSIIISVVIFIAMFR